MQAFGWDKSNCLAMIGAKQSDQQLFLQELNTTVHLHYLKSTVKLQPFILTKVQKNYCTNLDSSRKG